MSEIWLIFDYELLLPKPSMALPAKSELFCWGSAANCIPSGGASDIIEILNNLYKL